MRRVGNALLLLVIFLALDCGPAFLPTATTRPVTPADISGVWQYPADYGKTAVLLDLKADGTFVQTVTRSGQTAVQTHAGTWKLDPPYYNTLSISVLAPEDPTNSSAPWTVEEVSWWVVDSYQKGLKFAVFGGADSDADSFDEFKKVEK